MLQKSIGDNVEANIRLNTSNSSTVSPKSMVNVDSSDSNTRSGILASSVETSETYVCISCSRFYYIFDMLFMFLLCSL